MSYIKLLGKIVATTILIGVITCVLFAGLFLHYVKTDIMTSDAVNIDLATMPVNLSSKIYYQDKETGAYKEWVTLVNTENRTWVDGDKIPGIFKKAFIAIEDERFYEHQGVDWKRTVAAGINLMTGETVFGGSTITQQLIKNLTQDNEVTIKRKLVEICRALEFEKKYGKEEILEWYMNIIYFGRGQYGVGTAAEYYFDKTVDQLSLAEMCALAGIINNPSKYDPYIFPENNKRRQELILDKMFELEYIDATIRDQAKEEELSFVTHNTSTKSLEVYPYYVDTVIDDVVACFMETMGISKEQATTMLYYGGYNIYACVDMDIQKKMDSVYQDVSNIPETRDGKALQSSMVIIDPYTGDIVGIEGGVGEKTVARGLNWATNELGKRPPGSSIKPISVYAPAMEYGHITPNTVLMDDASVRLRGTSWFPKNDNGKNYGLVTVRYGVMRSLNTIAAQVLDKVSPAVSYEFLTNTLHMSLDTADKDYAPLAAGQLTYGTTTREIASAYTIFPNMGTYTQGRTFSAIYDHDWTLIYENEPVTEAAITPASAYWMTSMLEDAVTSGTGTAAKLSGMASAGKTGTTTDAKDRWFVGYTPYYVGAVWTGYEKPSQIHVSGNPAAKIWKQVMTLVHEDLEYQAFPVPEDTSLPKKETTQQELESEPLDQQTSPVVPEDMEPGGEVGTFDEEGNYIDEPLDEPSFEYETNDWNDYWGNSYSGGSMNGIWGVPEDTYTPPTQDIYAPSQDIYDPGYNNQCPEWLLPAY